VLRSIIVRKKSSLVLVYKKNCGTNDRSYRKKCFENYPTDRYYWWSACHIVSINTIGIDPSGQDRAGRRIQAELDRQRTGQTKQDIQNGAGRTRQAEQEGKIGKGRIGQAERDKQNGTGRTGKAERGQADRTGRTGQAKLDIQNGTGRTDFFF
jgi:hypothetical protein